MKFLFFLILVPSLSIANVANEDVDWSDPVFECRPYAVQRDSSGTASQYDVEVIFERDMKISSMRGCLTVILKTGDRTCTLRHHQAQSINPVSKPINIQFTNFYVGENFGFYQDDKSPTPYRQEFSRAVKWFRSAIEIPQIGQWKAECAALSKTFELHPLPPKCVNENNGPDGHAPCGTETNYSF